MMPACTYFNDSPPYMNDALIVVEPAVRSAVDPFVKPVDGSDLIVVPDMISSFLTRCFCSVNPIVTDDVDRSRVNFQQCDITRHENQIIVPGRTNKVIAVYEKGREKDILGAALDFVEYIANIPRAV